MIKINKSYVIKNLDNRRVCDMSADNKIATMMIKGCVTIITANPDGTLQVSHTYYKPR